MVGHSLGRNAAALRFTRGLLTWASSGPSPGSAQPLTRRVTLAKTLWLALVSVSPSIRGGWLGPPLAAVVKAKVREGGFKLGQQHWYKGAGLAQHPPSCGHVSWGCSRPSGGCTEPARWAPRPASSGTCGKWKQLLRELAECPSWLALPVLCEDWDTATGQERRPPGLSMLPVAQISRK